MIAVWLVFVVPLVAAAIAFAWLAGAVTLLTTVPLIATGLVCAFVVDAILGSSDEPPRMGRG